MNTNQKNGNDYLEIIFAERNKDYGSYELRKNYKYRLRNGMIATIVAICFIVLSTLKSENSVADGGRKTKGPPQLDTVKVHIVKLYDTKPKLPRINLSNTIKNTTAKTNNNIPTAVVPDHAETTPIKVTSASAGSVPGPVISGNPISSAGTLPTSGSGGSSSGVLVSTTPVIGNGGGISSANAVDQIPEFPGGDKALQDFLNKNLEYPEDAQEKEIEGKVEISFVVFEDGTIQQVSADSKDNYGFGQEGKRVVGKMPKWKPAMVGGKPVKCYFTVPISFVLN
jgi:periplasmic protein TonB